MCVWCFIFVRVVVRFVVVLSVCAVSNGLGVGQNAAGGRIYGAGFVHDFDTAGMGEAGSKDAMLGSSVPNCYEAVASVGSGAIVKDGKRFLEG